MLIAYFLHFTVVFKSEVHPMRETSSQTKHTVILEVTEFHKKDQAEIPRDKIAD